MDISALTDFLKEANLYGYASDKGKAESDYVLR